LGSSPYAATTLVSPSVNCGGAGVGDAVAVGDAVIVGVAVGRTVQVAVGVAVLGWLRAADVSVAEGVEVAAGDVGDASVAVLVATGIAVGVSVRAVTPAPRPSLKDRLRLETVSSARMIALVTGNNRATPTKSAAKNR